MKHFLSLGGGVQSTCLALLAARGIVTPMPDAAIFADTADEPMSVYRHIEWLEKQLPFPIVRVSAGRLMDSALQLKSSKDQKKYLETGLPVHLSFADGGVMIGKRACTLKFKIEPIREKMEELRNGEDVRLWIGISLDEIYRMKESQYKWCTNIFPLVEKGFRRGDCLRWMIAEGYPEPPRSACKKCPFRNDTDWATLARENPFYIIEAAEFERELQASCREIPEIRSVPYLHSSCKPIDQVKFEKDDYGQIEMFQDKRAAPRDLFNNECEGLCGV